MNHVAFWGATAERLGEEKEEKPQGDLKMHTKNVLYGGMITSVLFCRCFPLTFMVTTGLKDPDPSCSIL